MSYTYTAPEVLELLAQAMACRIVGFILASGHFKLCFDAFPLVLKIKSQTQLRDKGFLP